MPLHMRLPKLKGFKNPFRSEYQVVNLDRLAALFPDGGEVDIGRPGRPGAVRTGAAGQGARRRRPRGVALQVTAHAFSGSAREKITAAGGTVTELYRDDAGLVDGQLIAQRGSRLSRPGGRLAWFVRRPGSVRRSAGVRPISACRDAQEDRAFRIRSGVPDA